MNAHDMANFGAFGSSGSDLADNHCSDVFSSLGDVCAYTWIDRKESIGFSEMKSSGKVKASETWRVAFPRSGYGALYVLTTDDRRYVWK